MEPYRPPEPAGTRSSRPAAIVMVGLLVLAVGALVVTAAMLLLRIVAAEDDAEPRRPVSTPRAATPTELTWPQPIELAHPLEIRRVTSAEPGACPAGSDGLPAPDPPECLLLGDGFSVTELDYVETDTYDGQHVVVVKLPSAKGEALRLLTETALHERLALVYGGEVIMAPTVTAAIGGGTVQINADFTAEEAARFAARLRGE